MVKQMPGFGGHSDSVQAPAPLAIPDLQARLPKACVLSLRPTPLEASQFVMVKPNPAKKLAYSTSHIASSLVCDNASASGFQKDGVLL